MSTKRLYIGNLPFTATTDEIRDAFGAHGTVHDGSRLKRAWKIFLLCFGIVEMDEQGAQAAISALNATDFGGRDITVNEARERQGGRGRF